MQGQTAPPTSIPPWTGPWPVRVGRVMRTVRCKGARQGAGPLRLTWTTPLPDTWYVITFSSLKPPKRSTNIYISFWLIFSLKKCKCKICLYTVEIHNKPCMLITGITWWVLKFIRIRFDSTTYSQYYETNHFKLLIAFTQYCWACFELWSKNEKEHTHFLSYKLIIIITAEAKLINRLFLFSFLFLLFSVNCRTAWKQLLKKKRAL